jgi:hypothetical protein
MSKTGKLRPSLKSIVVKGIFSVPNQNLEKIDALVSEHFPKKRSIRRWVVDKSGDSFVVKVNPLLGGKNATFDNVVNGVPPGWPIWLSILIMNKQQTDSIVEVECRPCMYYRITDLRQLDYRESTIEEAQIECLHFGKVLLLGVLGGKEVDPLVAGVSIASGTIRSKLINFGLKEVVDCLDDAEKHIEQHNFEESLSKSRTAFEKVVRYVMIRRKIAETDQISNDIERLKKGYLDNDTADLLKQLYHYMSTVGTHETGAKPSLFEARLGYGFVIESLTYLMDKL